jgi:hypothetical protein
MSAPKPRLTELKVRFTQDADTMDKADQFIDITAQTPDCGGWFYVLVTERWAVDRPSELTDLIEQVKTMVGDDGK